MGVMSLSARKRRVMVAAAAEGVDALLVTHLPDVRYLCGFTGSSGVLVLVAGKAVLFTDGRYTTQAKAEVKGATIEISQGAALGVRRGVYDGCGAGGDAEGGAGEGAARDVCGFGVDCGRAAAGERCG